MNSSINKKPVHNFSIKQPYLTYIKKGIKTVEGRILSEKFSQLVVGDIVRFYNLSDEVICEVIFLHKYKNFYEMLKNEKIRNLLPYVSNIEDGVKVYMKFPGASRVKKMGCVAIGLEIINS